MARNYGGESSSSVRDELAQEQQQQAALHKKIELGFVTGVFVIAGLSVVLNIGKCVSYMGEVRANKTAQIEQEAILAEQNAKLQDPVNQFEHVDPTVGNMADVGQAIAMEQNKMIRSNQLLNNPAGISSPSTDVDSPSEDTTDHQASPAMTASGAVTLDPEDVAPNPAETPDKEAVEQTEGVSVDGAADAESDYEYTKVSDFNGMIQETPDAATGEYGASTDEQNAADQAALSQITGAEQEHAALIKNFKETYYAGMVTNVEGGDVIWSWYGNWVFSADYDYSINAKPDMKAVWICYDEDDTDHKRPLAFVTANYSHTTKRFTNMAATYTQNYVKKSESQASSWGNASDASQTGSQTYGNQTNAGQSGQNNSGLLSPDGQKPNGEGSENDFHLNITEDDEDSTGDNAITLTPEDSVSENSVPSTNTNPNTGNNKPASNPPGQASWSSGSGAGGATSGGSSGSWVPGGGGSSANPDGSWTPGNGASGGSSGTTGGNGSWTPSN